MSWYNLWNAKGKPTCMCCFGKLSQWQWESQLRLNSCSHHLPTCTVKELPMPYSKASFCVQWLHSHPILWQVLPVLSHNKSQGSHITDITFSVTWFYSSTFSQVSCMLHWIQLILQTFVFCFFGIFFLISWSNIGHLIVLELYKFLSMFSLFITL